MILLKITVTLLIISAISAFFIKENDEDTPAVVISAIGGLLFVLGFIACIWVYIP